MRYQTAPCPVADATHLPVSRRKGPADGARIIPERPASAVNLRGSGAPPGGDPTRFVFQDDPGGGQFVADAVRLRPVLRFARRQPSRDARFDFRVAEPSGAASPARNQSSAGMRRMPSTAPNARSSPASSLAWCDSARASARGVQLARQPLQRGDGLRRVEVVIHGRVEVLGRLGGRIQLTADGRNIAQRRVQPVERRPRPARAGRASSSLARGNGSTTGRSAALRGA